MLRVQNMDDIDDPMARASPLQNGFDTGPNVGRGRGGISQPVGAFDMSMDDDFMDPISGSIEAPVGSRSVQPQMRSSPGMPHQQEQRLPPGPQYGQQHSQTLPPSSAGYYNPPSEPTYEWHRGNVQLEKRPNCGFGLAVIGGIDKPTATGETSIIVSDILPNGPADGKLKKNDRVLRVNGINMENVDHGVAVGALRSAGSYVDIDFRRRVQTFQPISKAQTLPAYAQPSFTQPDYGTPGGQSAASTSQSYYTPPTTHRSRSQPPGPRSGSQLSLTSSQNGRARETVVLSKTRNEGFGMQLGWKLYVQGLSEYGVASNQGLHKGDTIVKINNYPVETLSLADAKRIIQTSGNTLNLEIIREPQTPTFSTPNYISRSSDRLDRLSIGQGGEGGGYIQQQQQQVQQSQPQQQQEGWELPPMLRNEAPSYDQDDGDPLGGALPPRPPLPAAERRGEKFELPPPRPPSPGKQEFMGRYERDYW